jgi:Flp pilus assembly protein TadB
MSSASGRPQSDLGRALRRRREQAARRRRNALIDLGIGAFVAALCLGLFGYAPVAIGALIFLAVVGFRAWRSRRRRAFSRTAKDSRRSNRAAV